MKKEDLVRKFLCNTDETGRFIVKSIKTGKIYFVEPIDGDERTVWGDYNPATKTFETGNYGKYKGSIRPSESMITKENGFEKIHTLGVGESPLEFIDRIDEEYYKEMTGEK
jgi:hypothetical protein